MTSLRLRIKPMIKPYRANASPKTKISNITTNNLLLRALALAPAFPATPIAIPAASDETPVHIPAAKCAYEINRGTCVDS